MILHNKIEVWGDLGSHCLPTLDKLFIDAQEKRHTLVLYQERKRSKKMLRIRSVLEVNGNSSVHGCTIDELVQPLTLSCPHILSNNSFSGCAGVCTIVMLMKKNAPSEVKSRL